MSGADEPGEQLARIERKLDSLLNFSAAVAAGVGAAIGYEIAIALTASHWIAVAACGIGAALGSMLRRLSG